MTRTYRKDRFNETLNEYITKELSWYEERNITHSGFYKGAMVKKTKEEREKDVQEAKECVEKELFDTAKKFGYDSRPILKYFETGDVKHLDLYQNSFFLKPDDVIKEYKRRLYVSKYKWVQVKITREEVIEEAKADYAKRTRDGYCNETKRNKGFKHDCKKSIRKKNKHLCQKVLKGEYDDGKVYPNTYEDKTKTWDWW